MNEALLLERTARSFHLTLRLLPRALRADASLGYLLARATDTIADTSSHPTARRAELLRSVAASTGQPVIAGYDPSEWSAAQRDAAERGLLDALPALWARLQARPADARARLVRVLSRILEGQIFDLERFGPGAAPLDAAELERYTFLVAGSAGEFLTDLCAGASDRCSSLAPDELRAAGCRYGQGLQLVNILRDRRMDAALGRVYVREDALASHDARARALLAEAVPYCASLRSGRLRYATLLPALLGWRTLGAVAASVPGSVTPAKVSRSEVRRWLLRALPVWLTPSAVAKVAAAAGGPAPQGSLR